MVLGYKKYNIILNKSLNLFFEILWQIRLLYEYYLTHLLLLRRGEFMRKWLLVVLLLMVINVCYGETEINIIIDSEEVTFTDAYGIPFIDENNRTQVPLRTALEHFGAEVRWVPERYTATVSYEDKVIEVPIGEAYIFVNGVKVYNDTKALIKNGRTYLPLRIVFESLGAEVLWEGETKSVVVNSPIKYVYGTEIGQLAQNIQATDQLDEVVSLEGLKGKNILLSYYATW